MANGTYGIKKPANITASDVEIFYHYRKTRSSDSVGFSGFKKINDSDVSNMLYQSNVISDNNQNIGILPGMYDLRLPLNIFGSEGFYTIYIKPKEIEKTIVSVGTLSNFENVRGIVIEDENISNGSLVGYRVEYYNSGNRLDMYRLITSNNKCEPVAQNLNTTPNQIKRYYFNDNSNLIFCTLTPSNPLSFNKTDIPNIGIAGQTIHLINTKFNPVMIEIEMTKHDIETISTMLEGEQLRNLDNSLITTFSDDGGIYHQVKYGNVVDSSSGIHHAFKINNEHIIDERNIFNDIKDSI